MRLSTVCVALCCIFLAFALPMNSLRAEHTQKVLASRLDIRQIVVGANWTVRPPIVVDVYDPEPRPVDAVIQVLEERNVVGAIAKVAVKGIKAIVGAIKKSIEADKSKRDRLVQDTLKKLGEHDSHKNYLVINHKLKHDVHWDGVKGKDWDMDSLKFKPKLGKSIHYDVYWGGDGYVINKGDGGYLNWGFTGKFTRDGGSVHFQKQ